MATLHTGTQGRFYGAMSEARVVERIARALAVAPSLGPVTKAWTKLGFTVSRPFEFVGCRAADVLLEGSGIRFLAPLGDRHSTPLASLVAERLVEGAGLLGWSWFCSRLSQSLERIAEETGRVLPENADGGRSVVVPPDLTPGAVTLMEPLIKEWALPHRNQIAHLDRLVLTARDIDETAAAYTEHFGLQTVRQTAGERRSIVLAVDHVGGPLLEIVALAKEDPDAPIGHLWGLTFESNDLDTTVACMRGRGIAIADPQRAGDRGRAVTLPTQIGGIQIGIFGK